MPTVGEIVRRLTPKGTLLQAEYAKDELDSSDPIGIWREAPIWPPDMFAICATLVRYSECYAHGAVRGGIGLGANHAKTMRRMGELWQRSLLHPKLESWRDSEWATIVSGWNLDAASAVSSDGRLRRWAVAALRLLAAADEASASVGFGRGTHIARMAEIVALEQEFATLTFAVDSSECSVQPKGRTPMVGCNLRSMSLHLALLPPASIVRTNYIDPIQGVLRKREFGVILVPFPYQIDDREFSGKAVARQRWGRLTLGCSWGRTPSSSELARFVGQLVRTAKSRRLRTDMLIFPELALSEVQLRAIWHNVRNQGVQVLLAGVHGSGKRKASQNVPRKANFAVGVFKGRTTKDDVYWYQPKHHRWRIDSGQISSYELPLPKGLSWWEDIHISGRLVTAARFTSGATLSCLVCEDLARVEPVQPVLREMGPSLLVALLMDGPQLATRWSARSATAFADDPGTSVLAVTSGGLVRRFQRAREKYKGCASSAIALWQEPGMAPREVPITPNSHAVHFCLKVEDHEETTLDGRNDSGAAEVMRLASPNHEPFAQLNVRTAPKWARPLYEDR